jgi:NAD(P)-dependent dehydrogenase (short-subunit alcohol dehydrogenase family)
MQFDGKNILITGGAGDIGFAVAERFGAEGAQVLLTDMKDDKLEERKEQLEERGTKVRTFVADVTDVESLRGMVQAIENAGLRIDLLFNNAGYQGDFKKTFEYPEEDFRKVIEINLIGAFNVLRIVSEHMVNAGGGAIVNTASMAGVDGPPNMIGYGSSKFGVIGITQSAAKDLAPYNIRVNAISPAFMGPGYMWERQVELQAKADSQYFDSDPEVVKKQMIGSVPMRRYGDITEIPGTVVYLMSEDSSYVTGVNIPISGGIR